MAHLVFVGGTKVAMFAQCRLSLLGGLASGATCGETCSLSNINGFLAVNCIVPESYSSCICGTTIHNFIIPVDFPHQRVMGIKPDQHFEIGWQSY